MAVQERVQVKRPPLDPWNTRELLWLVSAVSRSGDQNWVSVSRALRPLAAEGSRPADWFSQRSCAAQYGTLLERAEAPRRKKRISDCSGSGYGSGSGSGSASTPPPSSSETPQQTIYKRLTQDRIAELKKQMAEDKLTFAKITSEVKELTSSETSEARIKAIASAFENEQRLKQRETAKQAQWLREREDRRVERGWRRSDSDAPHSSPLLTSLLQNSSLANQIAIADTLSHASTLLPSTSDRTISELPTNAEEMHPSVDKVPYHELQKIEQIKSELQKIEQNLIASSNSDPDSMLGVLPTLHGVSAPDLSTTKDQPSLKWSTKAETMKTPEKVEIDDIEIKAEDVYAFSDIDIEIPPVSSIHKTPTGVDDVPVVEQENIDDLQIGIAADSASNPSEAAASVSGDTEPSKAADPKRTDSIALDENIESKNTVIKMEECDDAESDKTNNVDIKIEKPEFAGATNPEDEDSDSEMNQSVSALKKDLDAKKTGDSAENESIVAEQTESTADDVSFVSNEKDKPVSENSASKSNDQHIDSNAEIYDDAPMEVIKEDKPGKKRDYSRRKADKEERHSPVREIENVPIKIEYNEDCSDNSQESSDKKILSRKFKNELGGSRSESPATPTDSLPNSPAPTTPPSSAHHGASNSAFEQDKDYKIWKNSVNSSLVRLFALKNASLFLKPITDDQAPGYSLAIKKPMDLLTIRRNVDLGVIKTTQELERDLLLMLNNALMYNRTDHRVYAMTCETIQSVKAEINLLVQILAHATEQTPTLSRLTRPSRPASRSAGPPVKRKRGGGGNETPTTNKKRRVDEN